MRKLILKFYGEKTEDFCVRMLYFMNTIDTFFLVSGILSYLIINRGIDNFVNFSLTAILAFLCFKIADFHPLFMIFTPVFLVLINTFEPITLQLILRYSGVNISVFAVIQFLFMGIPDSIVARDFSIPFRKFWNSFLTIAATTVSLPVSVYFGSLLTLILSAKPPVNNPGGFSFWLMMFLCAFAVNKLKPRNFTSSNFKPTVNPEKIVKRVIILNIDGVRLDRFYEAELKFLSSLEKESTFFPKGILTVYRALTNPAFASILTGAVPDIHGIKDNNIKRYIKTEALPDIVKTFLYGSMHVKHFSKKEWNTKIVSLPIHSVYRSDDIMFDWLKEDLANENGVRLFVADISEADFLGHAYGSESLQYLQALRRIDRRIEEFFIFMRRNSLDSDAAIIICSDHGIHRIDHSYLLFDSERFVPCIITGKNIKKNNPLNFRASIMDIAVTVSYLLGVKYPERSTGRVFIEALT